MLKYAHNMKWPVKALFLTSIRNVGVCDLNGQYLQKSDGPCYMEGLIERVVRECSPGGQLHGILEVAGVITDDIKTDLADTLYSLVPSKDHQWIHPLDLRDHHGRSIISMTTHLPSTFRSLPMCDFLGRKTMKKAYELSLLDKMRHLGADIIVLDHYMARIEFLIKEPEMNQKVLNIHPAVTKKNHPFCFRGPTPTALALKKAKQERGVMTGATLHIVNKQFDDGAIIYFDAPTPVYSHDSPAELRMRNYRLAKFPVFIYGIKKFLTTL